LSPRVSHTNRGVSRRNTHVKPLTLESPAKINLGLWVGRRRPDGFHDIVSVLAPIELHDTITIRPAEAGIRVSTDSKAAPGGPTNLAYKAAEAFFFATGSKAGCRIQIRKRIPVGGGLGGGSSNAAMALLGLNRLYGSPLSGLRLRAIAIKLGSDVPFFLAGGACVARGRGEKLRRIRLPRLDVVLCLPDIKVPTAWAYAELDKSRARRRLTSFTLSPKILGASLRRRELDRVAAQLANSFEPVVFVRHPRIARAKGLLVEHGAYAAAMSGSGSTVFGLVPTSGWRDPMAALARHLFRCLRTRTT
jgi:4-diphosphocytidyl-2-C-methyl-D-erythritol kinase